MQVLVETTQWIQTGTFILVAAWALRRWARQGDDASRWLAATFASLGLVVATSAVLSLLPETAPTEPVARASIAVLVLFPYLLLRFLGSLEPVPVAVRRGLGGLVALLAVSGLVLPLPDDGVASGSPAFQVFAVLVVGSWVVTLPYVGIRFWLAGRGQPTLARRRLRLLSVASVTLSAAILLAALDVAPVEAGNLATQLLALVAAGLFLLGFAPPGPLRRLWRQPEEERLHAAAVDLMAATTDREVVEVLLPHLRRVVGASGVAMVRDGRLLGADGLGADRLAAVADGTAAPSLATELRTATLQLWTDAYTPFFGDAELELLDRLGLLADLALERTTLLEHQEAARLALEDANAELESFVYSASHDLKSPLIAMLGYADLLREEQDALDEDQRWYLERMTANGRYMEALIRDLLELSRVGRVQTATDEVDLTALAEEIAGDVERKHEHATVEVTGLPTVAMNEVRARQLLVNLIENAAAHAEGRPVTIRLATVADTGSGAGSAAGPEARAETEPDGGVTISVADDGPGIPAAYRELVFGVFERLAPDDGRAGTGIGLAICRKIVEAHGGRIWVPDVESGAEFRVRLPAHAVLAPPPTTQEIPA